MSGSFGGYFNFYLAQTRTTKAAKQFLSKALNRSPHHRPSVISTDKNRAYNEAIASLRKEGRLPPTCQHRQVKFLNNRLESDHGKLKQRIRPVRGFESRKTAHNAIRGFEVMRMFRKGQFRSMVDSLAGGSEARYIGRLFQVFIAWRKNVTGSLRPNWLFATEPGKVLGRPRSLTDAQKQVVREKLGEGASVSKLSRDYGVSRQTIQRARDEKGKHELEVDVQRSAAYS
ncbi:DDE-type integrase/transposase/recombinase [Aureimonas ureilytica]|uniref:DDE-type integrase/transposase/recombinase n=1 Tax=Aureimonas ureilytica TaxID=401562 RepID=UPI000A9437DC|nr:DDE-type integrase/transposase/recombinase [Aureimonas ureilytica]